MKISDIKKLSLSIHPLVTISNQYFLKTIDLTKIYGWEIVKQNSPSNMNIITRYTLLLAFCLFLCGCTSNGQTPASVKKAFKSKYPDENDPDWRIDRNGNYESHFKKDGDHFRADFSPDGIWIETELSIKKKQLPKAIQEKLDADYDDYKIVEIEKVDHHSKGVFYDVELKRYGDKFDVEFKENGTIIN